MTTRLSLWRRTAAIAAVLMGVGLFTGHAQQVKVSGVVTEASTGETIIGAAVAVQGTSNGTVTNEKGRYEISVPAGATLEYSCIGYQTKTVTVGKSGTIDVVLDDDTILLEQAVAIGYGTMKRSDLTGSVASISEDQIKQGVNTSIEQAMQGRIAGVQVLQNSGAPGGGISVQIRGINTFNGNEPLYIIDGVAMSGQTSDNTSVLSGINPSDIVSLEVLKDASATAIYGSRASNGVVIITTRRGEEGKPKISYEGYAGVQQLSKFLKSMTLPEYAEWYNLRASMQGWGEMEEFKDPTLLTEGTNWQKELFHNAFMHNHQVGLTGGSKGMNYAISGGYLNQDGIGLGSNFERFTFRANFDADVTSWLKVGVNASYASTKQVTTLDEAGAIVTALDQRPDVPARNPDGTFGSQDPDKSFNTFFSNPLFEATMKENYSTGQSFNYNLYANINPLKGLNLRIEYAGNASTGESHYFQPAYQYGYVIQESLSTKGNSASKYRSFKTYATYDINVNKFKMQVMAGHEAQSGSWSNVSASRKGYITDSIHSLNVGDADTATNGGGGSSWAIESFYGRFNFNYDDRYLVTATARYDGSSNLGKNNRWGFFPSAAFAWRINNESFLKDVNWLNNLKLRLGWGKVGNQNASTYAYGTTMKTTVTAMGTGFFPGNYANPDLQWEETQSFNAGIDFAAFGNRVEFIADVYYKHIDNLMMQASLPAFLIDPDGAGMSAPWVNAGVMINKGLELTLNTVNISKPRFSWKSGLTLSFNRNTVKELYSTDSNVFGTYGGNIYTISTAGQPVGLYYGYNAIGMFTCEDDFYVKDASGNFVLNEDGSRKEVARPVDTDGNMYPIAENSIWVGDYIWEDVNGDGIINEKDRKVIGNPNPAFTFGFSNTITWRNFELSFFFNGSYGNSVYNILRQTHSDPGGYGGKLSDVAKFARVGLIDPDGDNVIGNVRVTNAGEALVQRISLGGQNNNDNNRISSRFVEDGSYIRLKNISLAYNLPHTVTEKMKIGWAQVYVNVQNVFTISKYSGYDPEVGAMGQSVLLQGLDNGRYPSQRIYTAGIKFSF